jgi:hypothetical protein
MLFFQFIVLPRNYLLRMLVALRWLHRLHGIAVVYFDSFLIVLCSTILNYIYHLCALDVVASGINDIIVQTT